MKAKLKFIVAIFLLFAASAFAGKWTIDSFDDSSDSGEADNYITEEFSGSGLKPVSPGQVSPGSGKFYVRQKFEDPFGDDEAASYQIFQGRKKDAANSLGKISLEGIPYATLLKMKLFYTKSASGDDDLETVYYDGKDIFVEGEDPVYINLNGKMEELKPLVSKEYKISITSNPSGATVMVGNAEKGETPATFSVSSSKTITVLVSKEGYYTAIKPITPVEKQTTQEGVLLTEKKPLENPASSFRSQWLAAKGKDDGNAIKNIKSSIQQKLNNFTADTKKNVDAIMSKFPANPPKAANESANDYSARQSIWTNAQSRERDALNKEAQSHFTELKDLLAEVDASAGDVDFALKYEYIPSSAIEISSLGIKDFSLDAEVSNSRVKFNYQRAKLAYGSVPRNGLAEDQDNVHGVLKIWDTPNENGKYASIYDIAFFYNETPLKILNKGSFTLSEATPTSRNTEKDLNSRVAKYSGKAAWDKNDEIATLAILRRGEIPEPKAVASKQEADAYYDEDEDDDEFEDEIEEQEAYDYSRHGATGSATDIFGNTDEYLFWTGMVFAAAAIGTGVVGFLENSKYLKANSAYADIESLKKETIDEIEKKCDESKDHPNYGGNVSGCINGAKIEAELEDGPLWIINNAQTQNKETKDSYNKSRIIWFSAAGLSAAISIILFAW